MIHDKLEKFNFLLGEWNLDYIIPKSKFSEQATDTGSGNFSKILNGQYVLFEYTTKSGGEAKGIFAWDEKMQIYRYWWFENSGSFQSATCNFINDDTLAMNWHDTLLVQTFTRKDPGKVVLEMKYPADNENYELVLKVICTRNPAR